MTNKKGFTLIELLIVIAIIGILATLAVVAFTGAQQRSRDSKRVADIRAVVSAFASASQDGMVVCNNSCAAGSALAANTVYTVSNLKICTTCAGGTDNSATYINLVTTKDPKSSGTACTWTGTVPNISCDYQIPAQVGITPTISSFTLGFYLEGAVQSLTAGGHTANAVGISQ
jgi:prepilin-type N-terminal cleavage/methylation domain-containing protein